MSEDARKKPVDPIAGQREAINTGAADWDVGSEVLMRRVLVLTIALLALAFTTPASALTVTGSARAEQLQTWTDASRLPLPPITIDVVDGGCPAYDQAFTSCAYGEQLQVYLWTGAGAHIWLHEAWHVIDATYLTDADRAQASALMGLAGQPWRSRPATQTTDPIECFADVAATLSLRSKVGPRMYRWSTCRTAGLANRRAFRQLLRRAVADGPAPRVTSGHGTSPATT